jgi:hypothetical protein
MEEHLRLERVLADNELPRQRLDKLGLRRLSPDVRGAPLSDALDPALRRELHEEPAPPAVVRWDVAHQERLNLSDLHARAPFAAAFGADSAVIVPPDEAGFNGAAMVVFSTRGRVDLFGVRTGITIDRRGRCRAV